MFKASLAEELLSLLMTEERAESIVGDLAEEARREGRVWYWCSVAGVSSAMFFKAFGGARTRTLGFLVAGFALWLAFYTLIRVVGAVVGLAPLIAATGSGAQAWATYLYLAATLALSSFCAGLALGPRTVAEGVNATAPLAMFWAAAAVVLPVLDCIQGTASWNCLLVYVAGVPALYMLPLLAGGAFVRHRAPVAD
jgi:hypothetical protein